MKRRLTIILSLFVFMLSIGTIAQAQKEKHVPALTIVSGFEGGSNYQMAEDMQRMCHNYLAPAQVIEKEVPVIINGVPMMDSIGEVATPRMKTITEETGEFDEFLKVRDSEGSYFNFLKISKTNTDITFLQYDVLLYQSMKDLERTYKKAEDIRVIVPMGFEQIHLIALKGDGKGSIKSIDDLKGKHVAIGSSLQGTNITAKYIQEKTKIKWKESELPFDKALKALLQGRIDAFFYVGVAPVKALNDISPAMKSKLALIPITPKKGVEELKEAYTEVVIPANTYKWAKKDVQTYSVQSLLVTDINGQTPEDEENIKKLMELVKGLKDGEPKEGPKYHKNWEKIDFNFNKNKIDWKEYDPTKHLLNITE